MNNLANIQSPQRPHSSMEMYIYIPQLIIAIATHTTLKITFFFIVILFKLLNITTKFVYHFHT